MMPRRNVGQNEAKTYKDLKEAEKDADLEAIKKALNILIKEFNFLTKCMSLSKNFDGYIASVTIPATSNATIQHFLGITPKFRIILRQTGNGVITDVPSGWNDKYITLYNNGAAEVVATILIVRE